MGLRRQVGGVTRRRNRIHIVTISPEREVFPTCRQRLTVSPVVYVGSSRHVDFKGFLYFVLMIETVVYPFDIDVRTINYHSYGGSWYDLPGHLRSPTSTSEFL